MSTPLPLAQLIETDVSILLCRAFLYQKVVAFGDDGMGQYGRSDFWKSYIIDDIDIDITANDASGCDPQGVVRLRLAGYDSCVQGHAATDQNLTSSLNDLLKAEFIDPACLTWAKEIEQGENYITLNIDVPLLMDWA